MIQELKEIREQLLIAIENKDLLYAKMMVNRIDTLIYKNEGVKNNAVLPLVSVSCFISDY